ncbi:MAG TPA: universal stress protein [Kofleriaceae bacterium]|nr:universal stress protein [Kofleriaceae bacterium]
MARFVKQLQTMKPLKTILVPTDFSPNANEALDYAVELAKRFDARIQVLNVIPTAMIGAEYGLMVTQAMVDDLLRDNQATLDKLVAARTDKAAFAPPRLEVGDVRIQIERVASEIHADLIVMGTHGRRGVKRALLGSVAESVVRTTACPVLLVREGVS